MPAASGMQKVTNVPNAMHEIESTLIKSIEKEVKDLSSSERSPFRIASVEDVKKIFIFEAKRRGNRKRSVTVEAFECSSSKQKSSKSEHS